MAKTGKTAKSTRRDDFKSVAKRLECDESEERFNEALRKVAKAKPKGDRTAIK
jgi:hypothetical protein